MAVYTGAATQGALHVADRAGMMRSLRPMRRARIRTRDGDGSRAESGRAVAPSRVERDAI